MPDEAPTQGQEGTTEETTTSEEGRSFTQSELDAVVKDRLSRERAKYADYQELKAFKNSAEQQRLATMSEAEQSIEKAKFEAREEARREYSQKLAGAEVRAVLASIVDDPDAVLEDLDLSKFITQDGEVDSEAIKALQTKWQLIVGKRAKSSTSSIGHGRTSNTGSTSPEQDFAHLMNNLLS